jgi:hypothetical protein
MDNATPASNRPVSFEDSILSYEMARLNGADIEFRNVTLKVPVGEHTVGTKFAGAFISTAGVLGLRQDAEESIETYLLTVAVGAKVDVQSILNAPCTCGDPSCPDAVPGN